MIGVIFMFAGEMVKVDVDGNNVTFTAGNPPVTSTIEGLQISKAGVIKEFPDLEDSPDWRAQAIERFKDKIASFRTQDEKMNFIIEDLKKHGYIPKYMQKGGHRVKRIE